MKVAVLIVVMCGIIISLFQKYAMSENENPPVVMDSLTHNTPEDNSSTFVRHFKYRGIPIDKNIQDFADKLYPQGFALQSKDYDNHRYTFFNEDEQTKVIVEWDEVTGNVFMVYDIMVGTTPGTITPFNMADEGWGTVGRFDESHDCVEGGNGLIIFTDGDFDGNECLIFVDSINSKGYDLVNI